MEARTTLLLYTSNINAATTEIVQAFGAVTVRLSNAVFVASMPPNFDVRRLKSSSLNPPNNLDEWSLNMLNKWNIMMERDLLRTPIQRHVSLESRGVASVALVMEKDIADDAFPYVLAGAHSLAETYAKEPYANKKLTFVFKQYLVDPPILLGPPNVPPQLEQPPALTPQPTKLHISSWPSAVPFNDKLYCFYRGRTQTQSLFFDIYNGSSWAGEQQVPAVVMYDEGPSIVLFNNILYSFIQGAKNYLWYTSFNGTTWKKPEQVANTRMTMGPSAVVFNNKIYCFHQGFRPINQFWFNVFNGDEWGNDTLVLGGTITGSPSAVVFNNLIYCFYQGAGADAKVLMVNVLNPTTGVWAGQKAVLNTSRMSKGPSAIVVKGMLYCFYQDESAGQLYANVTVDGVVWGKERLIENIGMCEGLGTTEFKNKLIYLFQKGEGGKVKDGELWYRELKLAEQSAIRISQAEPSLKSLGYEEGYKGFIKLAADMKKEITDPNSETFGYVLYITQSPILYEAFADKIRMCLQYVQPSYMHRSFAKIFAAEGTYDQRILKNMPGFPPRPSSENEPSYTMAWMIDWTTFLENAQLIVFHRAYETDENPQLWVLFMDKRNSRWVEIEGPRMSARNKLVNGAPAPQFGPSSNIYIFYHAEVNQEMRYNRLGISNPNAEKVWDVEKVMHDIQGSNTPSAISLDNFMHVFHTGPSAGDEFRYTTLDLRVNQWGVDQLAFKVASKVAPSAVLFKGKIYVFSKGYLINRDKIEVSIWDQVKLTWEQPKDINPASDHTLAGEPTAVVQNDHVYVFYVSVGRISLWWNRFDGVTWHGPTRVDMSYPNVTLMDQGIGAYAWGDHIHCFFRGRTSLETQFVYYKVFNTKDFTWNAEVVLPTASGFSSKPGVILNHLIIGA